MFAKSPFIKASLHIICFFLFFNCFTSTIRTQSNMRCHGTLIRKFRSNNVAKLVNPQYIHKQICMKCIPFINNIPLFPIFNLLHHVINIKMILFQLLFQIFYDFIIQKRATIKSNFIDSIIYLLLSQECQYIPVSTFRAMSFIKKIILIRFQKLILTLRTHNICIHPYYPLLHFIFQQQSHFLLHKTLYTNQNTKDVF